MPKRMHRTSRKLNIFLLLAGLLILVVAGVAIVRFAVDKYEKAAYPMNYVDIIDHYASQRGLPRSLVYAVVRCESGFRPDAVSSIGARGLMQLTEETFDWVKYRMDDERDITYEAMFDPEENVKYGTFLIKILMDEFTTVDNALCAYHAGRGSLQKWLADPQYSSDGKNIDHIPFGDTSSYVSKVNKTMEKYKEMYDMQ